MKQPLALLAFVALCSGASAQTMSPLATTGYNQDVIADGTVVGGDYAAQVQASTTVTLDSTYDFLTRGFYADDAAAGLPTDAFVSENNADTTFKIQNAAGNNALLLDAGQSGSLTFGTPGAFSRLAFLNVGFNGSQPVAYTLNFADGTTTAGSFSASDNFDWANNAIYDIGRISRMDGGYQNYAVPSLYETDVTLSAADAQKTLQSVTFTNTSTQFFQDKNAGIFGISGARIAPVPEPASLAALGLGAATFLRRRRR